MDHFVVCIIVTSMWIFGINCLFSEGHILEKIGDWIHDNTPDWVYKPTIGCPACQSSLHGLLFFFVVMPISFNDKLGIVMLVPFLICLCGFNFLLLKITDKERIIIDDDEV